MDQQVEICYHNTQEKEFTQSDLVLFRVMQLQKGQSAKFSDKFKGPYEDMSRVFEVNYVIKSVENSKFETVQANRLKKYEERQDILDLFNSDTGSNFRGFSTVSSFDKEPEVHRPSVCKSNQKVLHIDLFFCMCLFTNAVGTKVPVLGNLSNCSVTTTVGVYASPTVQAFNDDTCFLKTLKFQAVIKKYEKQETIVNLYLCEIQVWEKECHENFVVVEKGNIIESYLPDTKKLCTTVMKSLISLYG